MITATRRVRLTADLPLALLARIRKAAAEENLTISEYVSGLLDRTVPQLDERGSGHVTTADIAAIDETRRRIMRGRTFTDDSAELVRASRIERSGELAP